MSSLDGAIDGPLQPSHPIPKVEDVKDDADLQNDLDIDAKPPSEDGDEAPQDDDMDLFGEDEVADEVKHEDTLVPFTSLVSRNANEEPYYIVR